VGKQHGFAFTGLSEDTLLLDYAESKIYTTRNRVNFRKQDYDSENIYFMLKID